MRRVIIIHGVNYFNEKDVVPQVRLQAAEWGVKSEDVEAFNWDILMDHPTDPTPDSLFNTRFIAELGAGILQSAHIGFFERARNGMSSPRWFRRVHNAFTLPWQIASCLLTPLIAVALAAKIGKAVILWILIYGSFVTALGLLARSKAIAVQALRRSLLVGIWGIVSGFVAPLVLPLFTIVLFVLLELLMLSSGQHWLNSRHFDTYHLSLDHSSPVLFELLYFIVLSSAVLFVAQLARRLKRTPFGTLLKVCADTCRYTGLDGYRMALFKALHQQVLLAKAADPDEIIFVTHSLGSVIAADYLVQYGDIVTGIPITLITMGSPLAWVFPHLYPTEYPWPDTIFLRIKLIIEQFRWINFYRRYDPVGRALGGPACAIRNIILSGCTENIGKYTRLPAHEQYWPHLNPQIAEALSCEPHVTSEITTSWRGTPSEPPGDGCRYGWNDGESVCSKIWACRKAVIGRPSSKPAGFLRGALLYISLVSIAVIHDLKGIHFPTTTLQKLDVLFIAVVVAYLYAILWELGQPFLNLAFTCYEFFSPSDRSSLAKWRIPRRQVVFTALCAAVAIPYVIILITTVSSWTSIGVVHLSLGATDAGYLRTVAAIDDHRLLIGGYPGVTLVDLAGERSIPLAMGGQDIAVAGYDPRTECIAVAKDQALGWGKLAEFPAQMTVRSSSFANDETVYSVGSNCAELTVVTNENIYIVDVRQRLSPWMARKVPVTLRRPYTAVVGPGGEITALCDGRLWIYQRSNNRAKRIGVCDVEWMYGAMSFSADGAAVAWVDIDNTIDIADVNSGSVAHLHLNEYLGPQSTYEISTALSPSGRFLAVGLPETIAILDRAGQNGVTRVAEFQGTRWLSGVSELTFMNDERFIGIADQRYRNMTVMRWRPRNLREKVMETLVKYHIRPSDAEW